MKVSYGRTYNNRAIEVVRDENHFTLAGTDYERDEWNGRCYLWSTPTGFYTKAAREGGLVRFRISAKQFEKLYKECEVKITEYEAWVAKTFGGVA
jgi:hypothetical protein